MSDVPRLRGRLDPLQLRFDVEEILREPSNVIVPDWWTPNGNKLYLGNQAVVPNLVMHPGLPPPRNAIVALARGCTIGEIVLWGDGPIVCCGYDVKLPLSFIACGNSSTIVINSNVSAGEGARVNARNGGTIFAGADGLWSSGVTAYTDDMHAICDLRTGERVNPKGGTIILEPHVWLGLEAMVLRTVRIGRDSVIGARSMVTSDLPKESICAGVPARVIREGVTWDHRDF